MGNSGSFWMHANRCFPANLECFKASAIHKKPRLKRGVFLFTVDIIQKLSFKVFFVKFTPEKGGSGLAVRVAHTP